MMAFYTSDFDDFGEYNYYSTSNFYTSYDLVPFQYSSSSFNDSTSCYDPSLSLNETSCYDIVPFQDSPFYSRHEYTEPNAFEYHPNAYDISYDPSEANYSTHNFTEPKLLEYYPSFHNTHYFPSDTSFVISYSNAPPVTDDIKFDDYDSTPYDGGYDIAQTYGKPLEASDQICHPRSASLPDSLSPINPTYESIPSPYGNTEKVIEKIPTSEPNLEGNGDTNEKSDNVENSGGVYGKYGYGSYDKPVIQFQGTYNNGYGLEAMDLCEGLFGYWPCLDKKIRRECCHCEQVTTEDNQWKSAADYLFGSYGYNNYDQL